MPPKTKKGKAAKTVETSLDDIDTTVLTRGQLEEFCANINEALTKDKQHTEFLRLDRDKLSSMVAIARGQLSDARNGCQEKEVEILETKEKCRKEMDYCRQRLIHMGDEINKDCMDTKLEVMRKVSNESKLHENRMAEIINDVKTLRARVTDWEKVSSEEKRKQEIQQAEKKSQQVQKDKELLILFENKRDKVIFNKTNELNIKFESEYNALNNRKDQEIKQLLKKQTNFTISLKHYYNQIINHNMSLLSTMKATFQEMKSANASVEKEFLQVKQNNLNLLNTLNESRAKQKVLTDKLASSKRDQNELKYTKVELDKSKSTLEHKLWELEALKVRMKKQDGLIAEEKTMIENSMLTWRATAEERFLVLENIVCHLFHKLNEADATLGKIKSIYLKRGTWNQALDSVQEFRNSSLDEANYQLATVSRERKDIMKVYRGVLQKYFIHPADTGFQPLGAEDILKTAVCLRVMVDEQMV